MQQGFDVDYLSVCDPISLKDLEDFNSKPMLLLLQHLLVELGSSIIY